MSSSPTDFGFLQEAVAFAARAHQGQVRKDGRTPYVSHVFRVCLVVRDLFGFDDPRMLQAALLHDTIEDTTTDFDEIEELFGPEVARWVAYLTKDSRLPEKDREEAYCRGLAEAPWQVKACKLADIYDNLTDSKHLPEEKRARTKEKVRQYLNALEGKPVPELIGPLGIVRKLLGC